MRGRDKAGRALILRTTDGREVRLGTLADVKSSEREITDFTGGSSGGGEFSALWGVLCATGDVKPLAPPHAAMVATEALTFQSQYGDRLSKDANKLFGSLASLDRVSPRRQERTPSGVTKRWGKRAGSRKRAD